jgi:hypothetical protein
MTDVNNGTQPRNEGAAMEDFTMTEEEREIEAKFEKADDMMINKK